MSNFYASANLREENKNRLENAFKDILYSQKTTTRLGSKIASAVIYEEAKVIPNLVINSQSNDSWLIAVGMPLLDQAYQLDNSVLLENFFEDPVNFLRQGIDGHFGLFAYNGETGHLFAATDFNRFIPIYYSQSGNEFVLSSSEIALAKTYKPKVDVLGFTQAVQLGVTWGTYSRFEHIHKLDSCELLVLDTREDSYKIKKYWQPTDEEVWQGGFDESLARWSNLLEKGIKSFYDHSGVESVSSDFTAGEDARLIVAQCHASEIPFRTRVSGFPEDKDVLIGLKAAEQAGFNIRVDPVVLLDEDEVADNAFKICFDVDGYRSFFSSALRYGTLRNRPPSEYSSLHFAGVPGGEVYRGSYYLRGKVLFPNSPGGIDTKFFTRLKFLLDYYPDLTTVSDEDFIRFANNMVEKSMREVEKFPKGTKIDHILRVFQNCSWGLSVRQPFYLPLGLKGMTRSIYNLQPKYKKWGLLTRACTEKLFPELAFIKTQYNVPTIRMSLKRLHYFVPGYIATVKKIANGLIKRFAHVNQSGKSISKRHRPDLHSAEISAVLKKRPYADWFAQPSSLLTSEYYNQESLREILDQAKSGKLRYVSLFGRIVNQELVCRYVYSDD